LQDFAGNSSYFSFTDLLNQGLSIDWDVLSDPSDTTPPDLAGLSFSPLLIDTSTDWRSVIVQMDVTDDLSGVSFSPTNEFASYFEAGISFRSPSGQQSRAAAYFYPWQLLPGGDVLDGTWQGEVWFPQYSEAGTWYVNQVQIKDSVRNTRTFYNDDLEAMSLPTELQVVRPSLETDGSVDDSGGTVEDETFGERASVTFPPGAVDEETFVAIDVFEDPLDLPIPSGFELSATRFVSIYLVPEPDYPVDPPGLTIVLPLENTMVPGYRIDLYRVDPDTGELVEAFGVDGFPVQGRVDPGGLTATFEGVASLSIVVGLLPETVPVFIDIKPATCPNKLNVKNQDFPRGATSPAFPQGATAPARRGGVFQVGILGTDEFDVTWVDIESIQLVGVSPAKIAFEDVGTPFEVPSWEDCSTDCTEAGSDGLEDVSLKFEKQEVVDALRDAVGDLLDGQCLVVELTGMLLDGTRFSGEDVVAIQGDY
jgi:hypothetical protein